MVLISLCEQEYQSCYISKLPISYYTLGSLLSWFPIKMDTPICF